MANKKYQCRLKADRIPITDKIYVRIPTIGEILDHEQTYYSIAYNLTSTPYQQMVRLDDMGIDYTEISEWELFMQTMHSYSYSITKTKENIKEVKVAYDEMGKKVDTEITGVKEDINDVKTQPVKAKADWWDKIVWLIVGGSLSALLVLLLDKL